MDIKAFKGLNTVSDPMRLGMPWLVQADNVNISDTGALTKREGYSLASAGNFTSAYSTLDFSRMYTSDALSIKDFTGTTIYALSSTAPMFWCEINEQVFFNNGVDSGIILPDNTVLPWRWPTPTAPAVAAVTGSLPAGFYQVRCTYVEDDGRETGTGDSAEITLTEGQALQISNLTPGSNVYICPANSEVYQLAGSTRSTAFTWNSSPDNLGRDLLNAFFDPLPTGADVIQAWKGRVYAAQYMPVENQTVIWFTEPLAFHLFNLNSNFFIVLGHIHMLAPHSDALVIGTDARVWAYDGQKLAQIAEYGVVPGKHWDTDQVNENTTRILFWSTRGLCSALPFTNLTEKQVSVAPGVHAGGCVVRAGGQKRYLSVLQQGGSPFNAL
jgi:hypothetical protein